MHSPIQFIELIITQLADFFFPIEKYLTAELFSSQEYYKPATEIEKKKNRLLCEFPANLEKSLLHFCQLKMSTAIV